MATIFKKRITRYVDANGRQCTKSTPGARKKRTQSKVWYGRYVDAAGRPREIKLVAGGRPITDERSARVFCNQLETDGQQEQTGVVDRYKHHAQRPLSEHVADYRRHLEAKNNTAHHVKKTIGHLQAVFNGCAFSSLPDLDRGPIDNWLKEARESGRPDERTWNAKGKAKGYEQIGEALGVCIQTVQKWRKEGAPIRPKKENDLAAIARWVQQREAEKEGMSIGTSNHYMRSVKSFGAWLVRERRWAENPFAYMSELNAKTDVRHDRRTLPVDQLPFGRCGPPKRQTSVSGQAVAWSVA